MSLVSLHGSIIYIISIKYNAVQSAQAVVLTKTSIVQGEISLTLTSLSTHTEKVCTQSTPIVQALDRLFCTVACSCQS